MEPPGPSRLLRVFAGFSVWVVLGFRIGGLRAVIGVIGMFRCYGLDVYDSGLRTKDLWFGAP